VREKRVSSVESKRLREDLETVYIRLSKRQYKIGGFSVNRFDIPDKSREVYSNIEYYGKIGRTWSRIFRELGVSRFRKIADLCSGYTPKVELGLYYAGYRGTVVALDIDRKSLSQLQKFISVFRPEFRLQTRCQNIFSPSKVSYEVVTANHILDDAILWYFAKKFGTSLDEIYQSEEKFIQLWKQIVSQKEKHLNEIVPILARSFDSLVKRGGYFCLAHYESYIDRMLDQRKAYSFTLEVFRRITKELISQGYTNEKRIVKKAFSSYHGQFTDKQCAVLHKKL
jgi:hypothetical protein